MKKLLLASAAVIGMSGFALAADPLVYDPAPYVAPLHHVAGPVDWSGVYLGIQAGYGWGNYTFDYDTPDVGSTSSGVVAGGTVGWNWQAPGSNIVLGLEGDFAWAGIKGSAPCPNPAFTCSTDLQSLGTVRGRLGVAMNTWLLYATGGVAFGAMNASTTLPGAAIPPSGTPTNGETNWRAGWTGGLGSEVMLHKNMSAKLEWLYVDLGAGNYNIDNGIVINSGFKGNIIRAGLNWHY